MTYQFITDAGHGWLQVPLTEFMQALRAGLGFSSYSYANPRTGMVYLEEDMDANTFVQWYKDKHNTPLAYEVKHYDNECFVRQLPSLRDTRR